MLVGSERHVHSEPQFKRWKGRQHYGDTFEDLEEALSELAIQGLHSF